MTYFHIVVFCSYRLSEYVQDGAQASTVLGLLLPFLHLRLSTTKAEEGASTEKDLVVCLQNLIRQAENPAKFTKSVCKLFSIVPSRTTRTGLCNVVNTIAERDPSVAGLASVNQKLNAWDRRKVEDPDYMQRIDGFQEAIRVLKEESGEGPSNDYLLMLVYNCTYTLATSDDLSLRDNAGFCLRALIDRIGRLGGKDESKEGEDRNKGKHCEGKNSSKNQVEHEAKDSEKAPESSSHDSAVFRVVVQDALMPVVREKLRLRAEVQRHEFIGLLAHLVRTFPDSAMFQDLAALTNPDPEADFFANIAHVQVRAAEELRVVCEIQSCFIGLSGLDVELRELKLLGF